MSNWIEYLDVITGKITGCVIEVHRNSGPGLLKSIYENALCFEKEQFSESLCLCGIIE